MTFAEMLSELTRMDNAQRLSLIEAATRMIREELAGKDAATTEARIRDAAIRLRSLYESGGELSAGD